MIDTKEFIEIFTSEVGELLVDVDKNLVDLEKERENEKLINEIFRAVHKIKSASGSMNFRSMNRITHSFESVMEKVRDKSLVITPEIMDTLFMANDALTNLMGEISVDGKETSSYPELIEDLLAIEKGADGEKETEGEKEEEKEEGGEANKPKIGEEEGTKEIKTTTDIRSR